MNYYLVTGISTGIGHAITQALIEQGHFVFGSVRSAETARQLQEKWGEQLHPLIFDVTDEKAIQESVAVVKQILDGRLLSGLVNNAGIAVNGPLMYVPIEDFYKQLDVNVLGVMRVCQAFLPLLGASLPAAPQVGRIVNISSISGRIAAPFVGPYAASKHALEALTHSLRRELLIYGIDVIAIQPGPIKTPIWGKALDNVNSYPGTDYESLMQYASEHVRQTEKTAIPAKKVAQVVCKALQSARPKTSYLVSANNWQYRLLYSFVPDRLFDYFIKKGFKKVLKQ